MFALRYPSTAERNGTQGLHHQVDQRGTNKQGLTEEEIDKEPSKKTPGFCPTETLTAYTAGVGWEWELTGER